jgi:uncharacterized protein YdaU (DUF1376 family)
MSGIETWMPLYVGDYFADTRRLNTTEHGAYLLLLMEQWRHGHVPDDDAELARIAGMRIDHWKRSAAKIRAYFEPGGAPGTLRNKRLAAERVRARAIAERRAAAAAERWKRPSTAKARDASTNGGPKPLENQETDHASASALQAVCTTQSQSQSQEDSDSLRASGAGMPRRAAGPVLPAHVQVVAGEPANAEPVGDVGAPENEAERIKRRLWEEGCVILRRLAPGIDNAEMRELIGWGAKRLGDGTRLVQVLRDVEAEFARAEVAGDPIRRIRGFIHTRAGTSKAAKAASAAAPGSAISHAERRIQELEAMRASR